MAARIVVDPITRIEGHLRIEAALDERGTITQAYSSGTAFRGIELIMKGRDPRDLATFTQRICGVCTYQHYERSTEAVERAYGIRIPPNARLVRNLLWSAQVIHDHVVHFYHLHGVDWFDIVSALSASPAKAVQVAKQYHANPYNASESHYALVIQRLSKFVQSGQLGPFAGAYWGHPAYKLSPEENLIMASHYLDALAVQRVMSQMEAIFGAKTPHPQSLIVGGVTSVRDALSAERIGQYLFMLKQAQDFIDRAYLPDLVMMGTRYKDEALRGDGDGLKNYMSVGGLPLDEEEWENRRFLFPKGLILNRDLSKVLPIDPMKITEEIAHSWYTYEGDQVALHPFEGQTNPQYTGLEADGKLKVEGKYSWLKSPRYDGIAVEVGPLARFIVGYAAGSEPIKKLMDGYTARIGVPFKFWYSTLGRTVARGLETKLLADFVPTLVNDLVANVSKGDERFFTPYMPKDGDGFSLSEVPRGSLSHWVRIRNGQIENFQAVVPSTWNASPKDSKGQVGAYEAALTGQKLADPKKPLEILRTIHSFDPCLACAVHLLDPKGQEIAHLKITV
ncbi:nickel-dependent hydrogenase large subunit [Meiothermus cerbereus]|uniref:nickel-dependent hydrogenase large subunit n=1 Tax=Meiothermus cerbereus TaxID=65552 RepID=UPI003EE895B3